MSGTGRLRAVVLLLLLLAFVASPAFAQYMFLDANGDGVNDVSDQLDPSGTTTLDIWIDTASNRDGSPAACDADATTRLSIFSWEVALRAVGGTLEWGPLENILPISPIRACFATDADTTDPVWYHNGWGGSNILDPGRYHLGRLRVRVLTGNPAVIFQPFSLSQPSDLTSFGTLCSAGDDDNTYKLGFDWHDTDGIGGSLVADAGGPYLAIPGQVIRFSAEASIYDTGRLVLFTWDFGDGATGTGLTPGHAYAAPGEYTVSLTADNGLKRHSTWVTVRILDQKPPVVRAGGPYAGYVDVAVFFDGRGTSDENGDPLGYVWTFGDAAGATGSYAYHTYHAAGTYFVTLTVSDGHSSVADATTVVISAAAQTPPIADAGGPYHGTRGVPLRLSGGASYDPEGAPLSYRWLFGDVTEGSGVAPTHIYAETGEYEIILEVSDGSFTTSSASSATIEEPTGSPPVVNAGGPYEGVVGAPVSFQGAATDADGGPISLRWDFGDRGAGLGATSTHTYGHPGEFTATLTASDGMYLVQATSTVTVRSAPAGEARAFVRGGSADLTLGSTEPFLFVQIEPVGASFSVDDIDVSQARLRSDQSQMSSGIRAVVPITLVGDTDGNGVEEATVSFRQEDVRRLFGNVGLPSSVSVVVEAALYRGPSIQASIACRVIPASGHFAATVRPNPFNPQATVSFVITKPGRVSAQLFSLSGRLVKTLARDAEMTAGSHDLTLDARGDSGATLSSGVYFLRIAGPDGPLTTRITIAK